MSVITTKTVTEADGSILEILGEPLGTQEVLDLLASQDDPDIQLLPCRSVKAGKQLNRARMREAGWMTLKDLAKAAVAERVDPAEAAA